MDDNVHIGHRQRLRERAVSEGLDAFNPHQILELLLFYCVPRKDTNDLAHRLLNHFGSFDKVIDATQEQLEQVDGVGPQVSAFLSMLPQLSRYYHNIKKNRKDAIMTNINDCGDFMLPKFMNQRNEMVYLLCMDAKRKVLSCDFIGEGSVNSANVPVRRIVETALNAGASVAVIAHNHPSGLALPSGEDVQTTKLLARALRTVDVILSDHLVFADNEFVSLAQSGYYDPERDTLI